MTDRSVLWLTPNKPENISVGRRRIARHLEAAGLSVELRGTTPRTVVRSMRERGRYDVVLGTTRAGAIAGTLVSAVHRVPLIVDHVDPISQFRATAPWPVAAIVERLENLAFRRAGHVLYVYDEERERIGHRATPSTQTTLGVDYDRFASPPTAIVDEARDMIGDVTKNVAVYVGGLEPMYSIEPLLESVNHLDGDWTLLILGAGSLEPKVRSASAEFDAIQFVGSVPHEAIPGYLKVADVGVALVDDPHTVKVLEYGAAGLPVVHLAGRAESRYGDRVTYCTGDPASVARAIETATRKGSLDRLQEFVKRYDWEAITEEYVRAIMRTTKP